MKYNMEYKRIHKQNIKGAPIYMGAILILIVLLIVSIMIAVTIGSADISIHEVYKVIGYKLFNISAFSEYASGPVHDVIWLIRLPRVILAVAIGMGLAVSGVIMQAIVKNPIADPYVLGISSGASLGATLAIMLGIGTSFGTNSIGIMAFIGALIISFAVMFIANLGGNATSSKLVLAGMALSSISSAFSSFIIYISDNITGMKDVTYWLMGSLGGANWENVVVVLPIMIIATLFFWSRYRNLNLMLLGDEVSITLGTDLHKSRHIYLVITAIMIGFAVYSSGTIGFVGLIIPHIVRLLFGTDHKKLVPISALLGAIFLIWSDVAARSIIPNSEMPIGILISIIGAPCFLYLMIKKSYGFGGN